MDLPIDQYLVHSISSPQWSYLEDEIRSPAEIITIPVELFKRYFDPITYEHMKTISKSLHKRVAFDTDMGTLSAKMNGTFIKVHARLSLITSPAPYPHKIFLQCKGCGKKWMEFIEIPPKNPDPNSFFCGNRFCDYFVSGRPMNEYSVEYVDTLVFEILVGSVRATAYVINSPEFGFSELVEKVYSAYKYDARIILYGFCRIDKKSRDENCYYIEVQNIDIIDKRTESKIIPFISIEEPTNEKETVMGSFFANIEYMRNYLGFDKYKLQTSYPDIVLYGRDKTIVAEFEYDVANFYKHKHDTQSPKCDLIIAWTCSTKREDYPYILLKDLRGTFIRERKKWMDPNDILVALTKITGLYYSFISERDIPLLLIPIIDAPIPIRTIASETFSVSYSEGIDFKKISFLLPKRSPHIRISNDKNGIVIDVKSGKSNPDPTAMDRIFDVKDYLEYIRNRASHPPVIYEKGIVGSIYREFFDVRYTDFILIVMSLFANFFDLHSIGHEFVSYIRTLLPSLFSKKGDLFKHSELRDGYDLV